MRNISNRQPSLARRRLTVSLLASSVSGFPLAAMAQEAWKPSRPVKLVVPFPAGGGGDIITRLIARGLESQLAQAVVVENKTGASGSIGSEFVYRALPDGLTLLSASLDAQGMYPHVNKVGFDSAKYVPIGGMAQMGYVLMGRPDLPATTLPELRTLMKATKLSYASAGPGSSLHVFTELFAKEANSQMLHVPFQGAGPGLQALAGGQVDLMMVPMAVAPQFRSKLRVYAVTSAQRVEAMKDVPTFAEQGLNVVGDSWAALLAPPGTPVPIVDALANALHEAIEAPEVIKKLREFGMTPITMSRKDFAEFYSTEYRKWGDVIKTANIRLD